MPDQLRPVLQPMPLEQNNINVGAIKTQGGGGAETCIYIMQPMPLEQNNIHVGAIKTQGGGALGIIFSF